MGDPGSKQMGPWAAMTRAGFAFEEGALRKSRCPQIWWTAQVQSLEGAEAGGRFIPRHLQRHHVGPDLHTGRLETQRLEKPMTSTHSVKTRDGA